MNVRKTIVVSAVGQNRMANGSQASGGIGLKISRMGKPKSRALRDMPSVMPRNTASTAAAEKPRKTRCVLASHDSQ